MDRIADDILKLARQLVAEEEDSNFAQKVQSLRGEGMRSVLKNKNKTLKQVGVSKPLRPSSMVEDIIDTLVSIAQYKSSDRERESSGRALNPNILLKGLKTLRGKRRKRLKNFGINDQVRTNTRVINFINDVVFPLLEVSYKEDAEQAEKDLAKRETKQVDIGQDVLPAGGFFEPVEKVLPEVAHQRGHTKEEVYKEAAEAQEEMMDWMNRGKGMDAKLGLRHTSPDPEELAKPGPLLLTAPLKGEKRATEKVESDYDGDWSQLTDVVRASVAVDSVDEIGVVLDELRKSGMKLAKRPKDRFANPTGAGYRDILMNVEYPNGHIGELQIHLKPILLAKDAGHDLYEKVREIEAQASIEGREDLTDEEQVIVDDANEKMKELYDKAWLQSIGRTVAGSYHFAVQAAKFFMHGGNPVIWIRNKFPIMNVKKKTVVVYDMEKFHREADPISSRKYLREMKRRGVLR